jgi:very-short-patch-repair endonuclease
LTFKRARSLRREMSLPERLLWRELRGGRVSKARFRRQHPIGPYILDFYCPTAFMAVEIDGIAAHEGPERARHDVRRDAWLKEQGIRVLRFAAADVLDEERRKDVLAAIGVALAPTTALRAVPLPRFTGEE